MVRRCCGDQKRFSVQLTNHTGQPKYIVLLKVFVHRPSVFARPESRPTMTDHRQSAPPGQRHHHGLHHYNRQRQIDANSLLELLNRHGLSLSTPNTESIQQAPHFKIPRGVPSNPECCAFCPKKSLNPIFCGRTALQPYLLIFFLRKNVTNLHAMKIRNIFSNQKGRP